MQPKPRNPRFSVKKAAGNSRYASKQINLRVLCDEIYRLRKQGDYYFSPVRDDGQNPAFAIREDGEVGIDHGIGKGFNALTLIAQVENLTPNEARRRLAFYTRQCRTGSLEMVNPLKLTGVGHSEKYDHRLCVNDWPALDIGDHGDYLEFAALRGLNPVSLITATALGLFYFFNDHRSGQRLCAVTDNARYVRQDRCVNGEQVALHAGGSTKSRTVGTGSWPVGAANIGVKPVVLLVEGMPDLLAAVQVIEAQKRLRDTAAVAMLGAGQRIHTQALPHFAGKQVRIFPDRDEAGARAAAVWQQQLQGVAASVDCFSCDGAQNTKKPIKDLNDFVVATSSALAGKDIIPVEKTKGIF